MKTIKTILLMAFLACVVNVKAGGTFTSTVNGVSMTFRILDTDPLGGVFVYTALIGDGTNPCISVSYNGSLDLPFNVYNSSDGKTYTIRGINNNAFKGCQGLSGVTFSKYMYIIGNNAFMGCSSIETITIPTNDPDLYDNITTIGESAFRNCSRLRIIDLGSTVKSIGSYAFSGCYYIQKVHIANIKAWCDIDFGNESANPARNLEMSADEFYYNLYVAGQKLVNLSIPNTVTSIKDYAFVHNRNLKSVIIPSSVTSIGKYAFYNCKLLETVRGAANVTDVGVNAFIDSRWYNNQDNGLIYIGNCLYKYKGTMPAHTKIIVRDGTKSIGYDAFKDCVGLEVLALPSSVEKIGYVALDGCEYLTDFYCQIVDPDPLDYSIVFPSRENVILHVPEASESAYRQLSFWLRFKDIVPIIEYDLYVMGKKVNEVNADDIQGDGKMSFDPTNGNVLYLNGASISVDEEQVTGITNMMSGQELVVVVNGDNTVESKQWEGFRARGDVHFKGNGTLRLKGYSWGFSSGSGVSKVTLSDGVHLICEGGECADDNGGFCGFYNERRHTWATTLEINGSGTMLESKGIADGIGSVHDINSLKGTVTSPNGAVFNTTKHAVCDANGNIIKGSWVIIKGESGISTGVALPQDKAQSQDAWYTLDGRKLSGKPTKKGVYIQNGKKTVVH